MNFEVGEKVKLQSGGPIMTVEEVGDDGVIEVVWFGNNNEVNRASFPAEVLTKYESR